MPDISEDLVNSRMEPAHTDPEKMAVQMKSDYVEASKLIKTANIKMEE